MFLEDKKENTIIKYICYILLFPFYLLKYAFIGLKACTYDLLVYILNSIIWKSGKAYKNVKDKEKEEAIKLLNSNKKKENSYHYSAGLMKRLTINQQDLLRDLQSNGAVRNKEEVAYKYKAMNPAGKIITDYMRGLSKVDIYSFLMSEGYTVYEIKEVKNIGFTSNIGIYKSSMKAKDLEFLLTQLSTYLKAGITLIDSLKILAKQMEKKKDKARAFRAISYELVLGSTFSKALEKQGKMFPGLLINMVKAAEASGTLTETLDDLAEYYKEIEETKKQMISAMTYPLIISIFAIGVVIFIMIKIIPQFVDIYAQNGININGFTLFVINTSNFLKSNILVILGITALIILVIILAYKNVKAFRYSFQSFLMHIPVVKNIIIYNELTIFTKTFASLIKSNVFIVDSIDIMSKITNNEIYKAILFNTVNNVVKGEKISEAFKDQWAVPDVAYFMIMTGETTGELDTMMQKVSEYYQGLHRNVVNNLKAFIEPILISFLALVVGGIIIAVVIPMFGMYGEIM